MSKQAKAYDAKEMFLRGIMAFGRAMGLMKNPYSEGIIYLTPCVLWFVCIASAILLAVIVGKGFTDTVSVLFDQVVGKGRPVFVLKNVLVSHPSEEHITNMLIPVLNTDVPVLVRPLLGRAENVLNDSCISGELFSPHHPFIFHTIEHFANRNVLQKSVSRTQAPFHFSDVASGATKVLYSHSPRPVEHAGFGPMFDLPSSFPVFVRKSKEWIGNKVSAFAALGVVVVGASGVPTDYHQVVREQGKKEISKFQFLLTQPWLSLWVGFLALCLIYAGFWLLGISEWLSAVFIGTAFILVLVLAII